MNIQQKPIKQLHNGIKTHFPFLLGFSFPFPLSSFLNLCTPFSFLTSSFPFFHFSLSTFSSCSLFSFLMKSLSLSSMNLNPFSDLNPTSQIQPSNNNNDPYEQQQTTHMKGKKQDKQKNSAIKMVYYSYRLFKSSTEQKFNNQNSAIKMLYKK